MLFIAQLNHKAIFPGHGKIATGAFGNIEELSYLKLKLQTLKQLLPFMVQQ